jgi:hypothetical protein
MGVPAPPALQGQKPRPPDPPDRSSVLPKENRDPRNLPSEFVVEESETRLVAGFVLISNNRQTAHADKRAELDYEVNVRTYHQIDEIDAALATVLERFDPIEAAIRDRNVEH